VVHHPDAHVGTSGLLDTVQALVTHIEQYIAHWNTKPTPFVWTREPADIIKKAIRRAR